MRVALLPLGLILFQACAPVLGAGSISSGVEGQVFIGPMCPVVQVGQECPDRPFQATLAVYTLGGRRVARFQTDDGGRFRFPLQPGEYLLTPESPSAMPYAEPQRVVVLPGEFTSVTIHYDSGIR